MLFSEENGMNILVNQDNWQLNEVLGLHSWCQQWQTVIMSGNQVDVESQNKINLLYSKNMSGLRISAAHSVEGILCL